MSSDAAPTAPSGTRRSGGAAASPEDPDRARLLELRRLLLGDDRAAFLDRWREISEARLDAATLAALLPDAVRHRSRLDAERGDAALGDALAPAIEEGIQASVQRNPQPLADAIFPVIGPAMRRAIQQALASAIESVNQAVEYGLTWRGLRWRVEAWRSGLSVGEVALRHTLRYRVEQLFLIHADTGLLLRHAAPPSAPAAAAAADLVSSMLAAVQTFVRDSFRVDDGEALDALQMGDLTVWIVPGPDALLAAAIRGTPPQELRLLLTEGLEALHRRLGRDLATFDGDVRPFEAADPVLYDLLVEQRKERRRGPSAGLWVVLALLAMLLAWWAWTAFDRSQRWRAALADLDAAPGLDVLTEARTWGGYRLTGLRDPDALAPDSVLARHGFADDGTLQHEVVMRWLPYQSNDPALVTRRAARLLDAPAGVALAMRGDTLVAKGVAPRGWAAEARAVARFVPGVRVLDTAGVQTRTAAAVAPVEAASLQFAEASNLAPGEDAALAALVADVRALAEAAAAAGQTVTLEIVGHTDETGSAARNERVSLQRAATVRAVLAPALARAGLGEQVTLRLVAARDAFRLDEGTDLGSRRVTFRVRIE